ncbi:MAG: sporulation protein YqfD [Clostridia bacterium]|nr:sporulation protein YqfD [Clostridia bacterium]
MFQGMLRRAITVEGMNKKRLYSALIKDGITLYGLKDDGRTATFALKEKDLRKAVAILDAMCYNYSVKGGVGGLLLFALKKLPMLLSVLIMTALVFASNLFVWRVEIVGAEGSARLDALDVTENCGVTAFALKSSVDIDAIEKGLKESGFSASTVDFRGNVLEVHVVPEDDNLDLDESGSELVSAYDGVITRIITESGTPLVKQGDVVKRGEVLISGDVFSTLDGSLIGREEVKGAVYAEVTFNYSYPISSSSSLIFTGREEVCTTVSLFGLNIGETQTSFEHYNFITETQRLYPLPITFTQVTYKEIAYADDNGVEQFTKEKSEELSALYSTEFACKTSVVDMGGVAVLKAYFTAEIPIGVI